MLMECTIVQCCTYTKKYKKIMNSLFNKPKQKSAIALRGKRILILCMARIHGRDF